MSLKLVARLLASFRGRRATRLYLRRLPGLLVQDYGHRGPYTPEQVEGTIRRRRVAPLETSAYALVIFCDRESTEAFWRRSGASHSYDALRQEIGDAFFGGDVKFSARHSEHYAAQGGTDHSGIIDSYLGGSDPGGSHH